MCVLMFSCGTHGTDTNGKDDGAGTCSGVAF